ncbi:MAG: flavin reductase family protein [Bacteroidetes bacterium]|nr:flavin reductase family protein [Bacteroidota bacterium]
MLTIVPGEVSTGKLHAYMLAAVAPRPICFASTVDKNGQVNLSPFSFFNAFGSNPTTLIFSPARRVRDNTIKHTLENVYETMEVCINVVNYDMVWQMSLASTEYDKGINEFEKGGFTELPSDLIRPPRVKESPVQIECKVREVIETGREGGAANLVICEILKMHISESVLDAEQHIDPNKIKLVARMGGDWYAKAFGEALFEIEKPLRTKGIGVDSIPESIRLSTVLTGNNLGQLGNVDALPSEEEIQLFMEESEQYHNLKTRFGHHDESLEYERHLLAQQYLNDGDTSSAWKILLAR